MEIPAGSDRGLDRAQSHAGSERVGWQQADALRLPFEDSAFDAIVCQFGVMFFPDKQAAFRDGARAETLRVRVVRA
jgi:ubiquinone/menaquinone biosynthesis C-methylase UbiE